MEGAGTVTHERQRIRETVRDIVRAALPDLRESSVLWRGPRTRIESFPAVAILIPSDSRRTLSDEPSNFLDEYEATLTVAVTIDGQDDLNSLDTMLDAIDRGMNDPEPWNRLREASDPVDVAVVELTSTETEASLEDTPELAAAELSYTVTYSRSYGGD